MFKNLLILLLSGIILFSCSKKNKENLETEITDEQRALNLYAEGVDALEKGDAYYAGTKFREIESLIPQGKWATKASLMAAYTDYNRNSYSTAIFNLERHIKNYPADKNLSYAHYLLAMCYYEQILDEKKDLKPLLIAKKKFEFIIQTYPETDYAIDSKFKLDLIIDQLAAKEMSIARYYMQIEKWIPALNRLKVVVKKYDQTVFVEEALHRLVEVYYKLGLEEEARQAASILGYNYQSGEWYKKSYKVFNKNYKTKELKEGKELSLIRKKIKAIFD